ncbi:STAS domain-containing protein [Catenuloplanes atrovinosus]|uniref:Anti-sigma factor antagonist n=1 Tax=Catenuloplanes atrovinosus TaxID=137266 RepID=A0AAE4C8U8_9ACTN|nr:STAS domain-containing protein [Catenuloplanes atrovinosus]MDR7274992.1 anti-anti-sigma factor [Catenuloplanes atrovinosus]
MIDDSPLRIDVSHPDPATALLSLAGDLDFDTAEELVDEAERALITEIRTLRLDLSGLYICDSSGLSALLHIHHDAREVGTDFEITGVTAQLRRILEVTGLDAVLGTTPAEAHS